MQTMYTICSMFAICSFRGFCQFRPSRNRFWNELGSPTFAHGNGARFVLRPGDIQLGSNWRKRASASWKKTTKSSTMITPPRISSHNWCVRCEPGVENMIGKRVQFHEETWQQLRLLASESMKTFQGLADEASMDLLRKHGHPASLTEALRRSADETAKIIPLKGKARDTPKKR